MFHENGDDDVDKDELGHQDEHNEEHGSRKEIDAAITKRHKHHFINTLLFNLSKTRFLKVYNVCLEKCL